MKLTIFTLLVHFLVLTGFTFQVSQICSEFFEYPTVTSVTIVDYLPFTNPPQVALCLPCHPRDIFTSKFQELLRKHPRDGSYPGGEPTVSSGTVNYMGKNGSKPGIQLTRFLHAETICFSVKAEYPVNIPADVLPVNGSERMVLVVVKKKRPFTCGADANSYVYQMKMISFDSDFDSTIRGTIQGVAYKKYGLFNFQLTYTQRVTQLLPPPYDTNCRDYRKEGLVSKVSCIKRCINSFTLKRYHMIFEDHVVDRDKYMIKESSTNSSLLRPIPQNIKYLIDKSDHSELTPFQRDLKNIINSCKRVCSHADCHTDYITPFSKNMNHASQGKFNTSNIRIGILLSREPVIVVDTKAKLHLLDLVVYILSCLSFWFGFCPLQASTINFCSSVTDVKVIRMLKTTRVTPLSNSQTRVRPFRRQSRRRRMSFEHITA